VYIHPSCLTKTVKFPLLKPAGMAQMESKAAEKVRQRDDKELEMIELEREVSPIHFTTTFTDTPHT
jgi:hypothetical protein